MSIWHNNCKDTFTILLRYFKRVGTCLERKKMERKGTRERERERERERNNKS